MQSFMIFLLICFYYSGETSLFSRILLTIPLPIFCVRVTPKIGFTLFYYSSKLKVTSFLVMD